MEEQREKVDIGKERQRHYRENWRWKEKQEQLDLRKENHKWDKFVPLEEVLERKRKQRKMKGS